MFAYKDGMITINIDNQSMLGEDLRTLFDFCFSNSDTISLSQSHNIGMTKAEADVATSEYNEYLKMSGITEGLIPSEEEMLEVYQNIAETEEEMNEMIRRYQESKAKYKSYFKMTQEDVERYLKEVFADYKLIDRDVTCMTPCTYGAPQVIYYLISEESIKHQIYNMKELFQPVITNEVEELRLDDLTFYKEGKIFMLVCSHEGYATLFLNEVQYNVFSKLKVPYKVV